MFNCSYQFDVIVEKLYLYAELEKKERVKELLLQFFKAQRESNDEKGVCVKYQTHTFFIPLFRPKKYICSCSDGLFSKQK